MTPSRPGWMTLLSTALLAALLAFGGSGLAVAADPLLVINQVSLDRFPEITVYFTAVDSSGLPIADISKDRLQVVHNGRSVPDLSLELAESEHEGLAVVVAVDTSGSMQGPPLENAKAAVRIFLERMRPNDRGALVAFGQTARVVQDLTSDREALNQALDSLAVGGDTTLYDGAFQAITLASRQTLGRRAVVVITDGEDTHSSLTLDDVIGKARQTNTPVSAIGLGEVKLEPVQRLAAVTGGSLSVAPSPEHLAERAGQMSDLLRKQYVLRYRALDSRPPENEVELVLNQEGRQNRTAQRFPAPPMPPLQITLAEPAPGSTVRGAVELRPTLPNASRVDRVEYQLDGTTFQAVTDPPYSFTWNTGAVQPGEHVLTVTARLGDQEAQQQIPVIVAPPFQVTIQVPTGQDVSGRVKLTAAVEPAVPIAGVTWAVDGQPIGTAGQPPFEIEWDSASLPPGQHTITAEARDPVGNVVRATQTVRVLPPGAAAGATAAPGATTAAGTPAATATARSGATATAGTARTPTATPTGSRSSGLFSGASVPLLIGIGTLVVAGLVGLIYASTRRRESDLVDATGVPVRDEREASIVAPRGALPAGRREDHTLDASGPPTAADRREAVTSEGVVLPPAVSSPPGALGRSMLTVTVTGAAPCDWPLGIDQIIGRAEGPGVIVVADPQVSRRHARITFEGGSFIYRDLGPMNPTRREGRTLPNPYILRDGDRLRVGRSELIFRA